MPPGFQPYCLARPQPGPDNHRYFISSLQAITYGAWSSAVVPASVARCLPRRLQAPPAGGKRRFPTGGPHHAALTKGQPFCGRRRTIRPRAGQEANCQTLVSTTLASGEVPMILGLRLFLPETRTSNPAPSESLSGPRAAYDLGDTVVDPARRADIARSAVRAGASLMAAPLRLCTDYQFLERRKRPFPIRQRQT